MKFLPHHPRVTLTLDGHPLDADIALAAGFFARLRGLMFAPPLPARAGLLIVPCNSIHMLGMRARLEAVFLSKDFRVLKISRPLLPWLGLSACPGAAAVLEWTPGTAQAFGIREGEKLRWAEQATEKEAA